MPITPSQVVIRVRKVLDNRVALACRPVMPDHKFATQPCLGIVNVGGLAGSMETEFAPEHLQLSALELSGFSPADVSALGTVVYNRVRAYARPSVLDRVIETIKSALGPVTVTNNTLLGVGGLNLSQSKKGDFAGFFKSSFKPLIRLDYSKTQAAAANRVSDWVDDIRAAFAAQGR